LAGLILEGFMKLRIKGNSIRLRLGQSEVRRLVTEGILEELTSFGLSRKQHFGYSLCASPAELGVSACFADQRIVICAPPDLIHQWATTDLVGIGAVQHTGDGGELRIIIEKDFECVDGSPEESQEDAFPYPKFSAACAPATVENDDLHDEHRIDPQVRGALWR
jgi:hypothetical protein